MSAAYRIKYRGPTGDCPDAVVTFEAPIECAVELAQKIKQSLISPRGGHWEPHDVTVREIIYLGPWFHGEGYWPQKELDEATTLVTAALRETADIKAHGPTGRQVYSFDAEELARVVRRSLETLMDKLNV